MGKILMSGTSGGVASDDITAKREDIIVGKTAITADSDDEIVEGTLHEYGREAVNAVGVGMASNGTHYNMHCPRGAYRRTDLSDGAGGVITTPLTDLRTTIGYTNPAKVLNDTTIAGLKGTIPIQGGSTIVPGTGNKTAISAGRYASGNIIVSGDPNLNAANIKKNVTIFGVRGSFEGYVTSPLYLYNQGSWSNIQSTGLTATVPNVILEQYSNGKFIIGGASGYRGLVLARLNTSVNLSSYNYVNVNVLLNNGGSTVYVGVSSASNITSAGGLTSLYSAAAVGLFKSNVSSLNGNYFIYIGAISNSTSLNSSVMFNQIYLSDS